MAAAKACAEEAAEKGVTFAGEGTGPNAALVIIGLRLGWIVGRDVDRLSKVGRVFVAVAGEGVELKLFGVTRID